MMLIVTLIMLSLILRVICWSCDNAVSMPHQSRIRKPGGLSSVFSANNPDSSDLNTFMLDEELEFDHGESQRNNVAVLKRYLQCFSFWIFAWK